MLSGEHGTPNDSTLTAANLLTGLRVALVFPFLYLIGLGRFDIALVVFFLAGATDFADGYVARRFNQHSRLGRILDPLADKLLVTCGFVVMAMPHSGFPSIPTWLAAIVVLRDLVILVGSLVVYLATRFKDFTPNVLGKITTFLEISLIFWFLALHTIGRWVNVLPFLYVIAAAFVFISGAEYLRQGFRILISHRITRPLN